MMDDYAIEVENVKIRFNLASEKVDNLKEYAIKLVKRQLMFQEFLALQDINLKIRKGESWGLVGANGSGKSTLLKTISGILKPDEGTVRVKGSVAPLIELGAGFDGNLTGRENIFLNGMVLGHSRKFMEEHFDEIVEFANLKNFLDSPIKNFSSGMKARLGFAVATMVSPDILIVDEVLEVGDMQFRRRCNDRMQQMLSDGTTLLYVSHNINSVMNLCEKAVWLDHGKIRMTGDSEEVCNAYKEEQEFLARRRREEKRAKFRESGKPYDYLVVGAGLYGAVFAREMAKAGKHCLVIDRRSQVGGNASTEETDGIQVHSRGPHIFHTSNRKVWGYMKKMAAFNNFRNAPVAVSGDSLYSLPFNMNTFYQLWGLKQPKEVQEKIAGQTAPFIEKLRNPAEGLPAPDELYAEGSGSPADSEPRDAEASESPAAAEGFSAPDEQNPEASPAAGPRNLEERALAELGSDLYEKLVRGYMEKQWGRECRELPADFADWLPLRFNYDNTYCDDVWEGVPVGGYTQMVMKILENVDVMTDTDFFEYRKNNPKRFRRIVYTGSLDEFYGYRYGALEYRAMRYETERLEEPNYQGNAIVQYTDREIPYTRIIEHKHFAPEEEQENPKEYTIISREYPEEWKPGSEPCFPVRDEKNLKLFEKYRRRANKENKVIFGGWMSQYRFCTMDEVVAQALADAAVEKHRRKK